MDKDDNSTKPDIIKFPSLAERDRMRKEKKKQEQIWQDQYRKERGLDIGNKSSAPFFNFGKIPNFVKIMIVAFVTIHIVLHLILSDTQTLNIYTFLGFTPGSYTVQTSLNTILGPFAHSLIHASWMHLGINTLMFTAFGTFFSREFGEKLSIFFFIICALGGALLYFLVNPYSELPLIGASGAISGFFGIFIILMYKRGAFGNFQATRQYGALPIIIFWVGFMLLSDLILGGGTHSWEAHIGGFIAGLMALSWLSKKDLYFWRF